MSGAAVIRALLAANVQVLALVPAARVYLGVAPQNTALPAISVSSVDAYELDTVARDTPTNTIKERVQVTVMSKGEGAYKQQKMLIAATKMGAGVHRGAVAGFTVLAIRPAGIGPDLNNLDDDGIYEQSRDFMVTFVEAN